MHRADLDDTLLPTTASDSKALQDVSALLAESHPDVQWDGVHAAWKAAFAKAPWDKTHKVAGVHLAHEACRHPRARSRKSGTVRYDERPQRLLRLMIFGWRNAKQMQVAPHPVWHDKRKSPEHTAVPAGRAARFSNPRHPTDPDRRGVSQPL